MTSKKDISIDKDYVRKQSRNKWTIILFFLYFFFGLTFVLFGHKVSSSIWVPSLFISCLSPIMAAGLWLKCQQKTKWQDIKSTFKMILFGVPFALIVLLTKDKYRDFHLKNYRALTTGLVVDTGSQYNARGGTTSYYAIILCSINNSKKQTTCYMHPNEYHIGDSVFVAYSYKDTDFYELAGHSNDH